MSSIRNDRSRAIGTHRIEVARCVCVCVFRTGCIGSLVCNPLQRFDSLAHRSELLNSFAAAGRTVRARPFTRNKRRCFHTVLRTLDAGALGRFVCKLAMQINANPISQHSALFFAGALHQKGKKNCPHYNALHHTPILPGRVRKRTGPYCITTTTPTTTIIIMITSHRRQQLSRAAGGGVEKR